MLAPADDDFAFKLFSDRMVPQSAGFSAWNRLLNKWLLGAQGQQLVEGPFHVSVRLRVLPEIRYGWGIMDASVYERPRELVTADNDDIVLFFNLAGTFTAAHAGREILLAPGDAYAMTCSERGSHARPEGGKILCLRVRRDAVRPLVRNLDDRLGLRIPGDSEALRMLGAYLRLTMTESLSSEPLRLAAAHHVHDLLALTLGAIPDYQTSAEQRGLHAARYRAAKALVRRNLADPQLSAEFIAGRLGMSARSLQRLFEREGLTFSGFVTGERLARVHSVLGEDQSRTIAEIAMDCGFGDISYFNRKFRARYHAAPSDVRNGELRSPGQFRNGR